MKVNTRMPPATVVVLGTGVIGHAAAVALCRALPGSEVTLATRPGTVTLADDTSLLLPSGAEVLGRLGLDEEILVRAGCASHRLCERFEGWGAQVFTADPTEKPRLAGAAMHQLWLLHKGMPFEALSAAASLAKAGRFAPGPAAESSLALDSDAFLRLLIGSARRLGVHFATADHVSEPSGTSGTVRLADGRSLSPDLLIDAGGQPIGPAERAVVTLQRPSPGTAVLFDTYRKIPNGWRAHWCGPGGGTEVVCYENRGDVGPSEHEGWRCVQYPIRRAGTPLVGNRLTLPAAPGPFLRLGLTLSLRILSLLLELTPGREAEPLLANEFNRRARQLIDDGVEVVETFASPVRSEKVQALTRAFARQGRLPPDAGELVGRSYWQSLLIGLGVDAVLPDALAASVPGGEARAALHGMRGVVAAMPERMPDYVQWLKLASS